MITRRLPNHLLQTTISFRSHHPYILPYFSLPARRAYTSASPSHETLSLITRWRSEILPLTSHTSDVITPSPFNLLALTLDHPEHTATLPPTGTLLPPNWHLAYFPPRIAERDLAADGYERSHMPPEPFIQRMWAGGKLEFNRDNPLRVGDECEMVTRCKDVEVKKGRTGESVFVWVEKEIRRGGEWGAKDTRCLVYMRRRPVENQEVKVVKANKVPNFSRIINPTSILLFRYSALTFNSHLIHYDNRYATELEGHPGCLVHGPLNCTLLLHLLWSNIPRSAHIESFSYRALSPLYAGEEYRVCGREGGREGEGKMFEMWAEGPRGLAMSGTAVVVD